MASKINDSRIQSDTQTQNANEDVPHIDAIDDFDPFSGEIECVEETVDVELKAPPESQWYHGRLPREKAEERLQLANQEGGYIIRESERKPGNYVLSFYGRLGFRHFKITAMCGDYYIGGREFASLSDLIGYYTTCSDLLKNERLRHPVPPPEPVNDTRKLKAILPYTKIPDTDELSFQRGEIFTFSNDMGDGWLWVTSQSTKLSGIVNQELVQELNGNIDPVEQYEWFHHDTTKAVIRDMLAKAGANSWLVRPSESDKSNYTLYFLCEKDIQRFRIEKSGNGYLMGGRFFESVYDITERYKDEQIVEGHTLGTPVPREERDAKSTQDIYDRVGRSSGSNFLRDHLVIKGFLSKKSQKSKKWKNMYFVLNGTESHLYYFENQKRTKPKGLIDLSFTALYPVHDSFFGRPNCFQLVVSDLSHVSHYYMCADNSDQAQDWVKQLKPYCTNSAPIQTTTLRESWMTELHSLSIKVHNPQNVPQKLSNCYCVVSLNDVKVARTSVTEKSDPCWDEEFFLDDIPPNVESFTVSIYNKCKRSKDTDIASTTTAIACMTPGESTDSWHILTAAGNTNKECGTLRLSIKYQKLFILPVVEYTALRSLLTRTDLEEVLALCSVSADEDRVLLAYSLLQIFRHERQESHLLRTFNDLQIENESTCGDKDTLFRSTSMATTLMDQYMTMTCTDFVHQALKNTITKIMDSKNSCEINPTYLDSAADIQANTKHLVAILTEAVHDIFHSVEYCPKVLRYLCFWLQKKVKRTWPENNQVKSRVVSGFIFLRLLCPAIINPKKFNLITEAPSPMAYRTLILVANCIIKLANLAEAKEPYMAEINQFIRDHQPTMVRYLDELSNLPEISVMPPCPTVDIARSLATVHQICIRHKDRLQRIKEQGKTKTKLLKLMELLNNHEAHYLDKSSTAAR